MSNELLSLVSRRIVVADGAMGTRLQALVGSHQACIDSLNLDTTFAEIVALVHRSYLEAGADLILTNTYGANSLKLGRHGRASAVRAINMEGARIARRCVDHWSPPDAAVESVSPGTRLVGGSVGPLDAYAAPEDVNEQQQETYFYEQMAALVDGGVDFILLETFQDLREAAAALRVAQRFSVPTVLSVGGVQAGRTGTGADVREFALLANRLGACMLGCNCRGPFDILETVQILAQVTTLPLVAMPNAGSPEIDRGRVAYHVDPEQFAQYAVKLVEAGAAVVGGCCGTEPSHIHRLASLVQGLPPAPVRHVSEVRVFEPPLLRAVPTDRKPGQNIVEQVFSTVPFVVSVEMRAGREKPLSSLVEEGRRLAAEGVHLFDVPDNAGARVSVDPLVSGTCLQRETGIPTIIHLSTSHRNLVATQSYLLGCAHSGIEGVLAVTGDHPNVGDHDKYASRVNDLKSSVNLMSLLGMLNRGRLFNETPCFPTNFCIGGGFNPVRGLTAQVKWLQRKIDAGARFVFTQPVYREEDVDRMLEVTSHVDIPILVGIMPLTGRRNAEFFAAGNIPGIVIPPEVLDRFSSQQSAADGRRLGLDLSLELIQKIRAKVRGLYLLPPFGKQSIDSVVEMLGLLNLNEGVPAPR